MRKTYPIRCFAAVILGLSAAAAHAGELDLSGNFNSANQIDTYTFSVSSLSDVNLYTTSDYPVNPLLTLWSQSGSDWQQVAVNDDRVGANFGETVNALDAKIDQLLASGNYEVTVTWSGNTAAGNFLSNGFTLNGNGGNNLFDTYNPYQLTVVTTPAPVPLPSAAWLFGSMILGFMRWPKKKGMPGL